MLVLALKSAAWAESQNQIHVTLRWALSLSTDQLRFGGGAAGAQGGRPAGKVSKPKVFITSGRDVPLRGMCLVFNRVHPDTAVTPDNIAQVHVGGGGVCAWVETSGACARVCLSERVRERERVCVYSVTAWRGCV